MRRFLALLALLVVANVALVLAATQERVPTGVGATDLWELGAGSTKTDAVDDAVGAPDGDTSYIRDFNDDTNQTFTFTAVNITAVAGSIDVNVIARCRNDGGSNGISGLITLGSGTTHVAAEQAQTGSYADYTFAYGTNPVDSVEWLESEVEGSGVRGLTEIGVRSRSMTATDGVRCTQVYLSVSYTENTGRQMTAIMGVG